jgi:hypothetical protein
MPQFLVKPANQVVVQGNPIKVEYEIGPNATEAKMLPGRLVIYDNAAALDYKVKEAGDEADNVIGFLDVEPDELEATHYDVADQALVVMGECIAKLLLLASESVAPGDWLVAASDGKVKKQAVGAMGSQGMPIGQALETSNVTVDAEILVHWIPCAEPAAAS